MLNAGGVCSASMHRAAQVTTSSQSMGSHAPQS